MRSDNIILSIKDEAIHLLETTTLSCKKIGNKLGCSRGPIYTILKKYKVNRHPLGGTKIKPTKECKWCGKDIPGRTSKTRPNRHKYCNKECYTKWQMSEYNRGENHPSYRYGSESPLQKLRKTDEWKIWREEIFNRDNYTCKLCGNTGKLHPHHIIPKSHDITKVFEINNGITLCEKCHLKTPGIHSKNSKYQSILKQCIDNLNR